MPESVRTRLFRLMMNRWPCYRGSGGRVTYIAGDFHEVKVRLGLTWRTKNYVGTIFGGSMYASVDPVYMTMLINILGPEYVVWDKSATIRFKKPGKETLHAHFLLTPTELRAIRDATQDGEPVDRTYTIQLTNEEGIVCAEVDKIIYVRQRREGEKKQAIVKSRIFAAKT